jgi:putative thioredoxin
MSFEVKDFENEVIQRSFTIPVLVDFWAPWAAACQMFTPVLEKVSERFANQMEFGKVNIQECPEIAKQQGVTTVPVVKLFVFGEVFDEFAGARPEYLMDQWIRQALPGRFRQELERSRSLLGSAETTAEAQKLLMEILSKDPDNQEARVLMAQSFLYTDPMQANRFAGGVAQGSDFFEQAFAIRILARLLTLPPSPPNAESSAAAQAYEGAIRALKARDNEAALQGFLEVVRLDRAHDNDGARKACIGVFKVLGERNPLTAKYRAELSALLNQ